MTKYTKMEIESFLQYETDCADVAEMYSEQMAEAGANAFYSGMDGISADAMPQAITVPVPDGWEVWADYYAVECSLSYEDYKWLTENEQVAIHQNWRQIVIGISVRLDREMVEAWAEAEEQARAELGSAQAFAEQHGDYPF